jgi:PAS domain-containing protein
MADAVFRELRPDATEGTLAEETRSAKGERIWRVVVDSIPGQVALLKVNGEVDFANREILDYTGRTLEQLKQWGTTDIVHPEGPTTGDRGVYPISRVQQSLRDSSSDSAGGDGVYRWFHEQSVSAS